MKKIIFVALIIGATTFTQAQSNLVFNQALLLTLSNTNSHIVPQGKVWKIEAPNLGGTNQSVYFRLNGSLFNFSAVNVGSSGPIWLPEGTLISYGGNLSNGNIPTNLLSILEFDVVPVSTGSGSGSGGGGVSSDGLVFSSVINLEFNGNSGSQGADGFNTVGVITVPEGKIWKVVSASGYSSAGPNIAGYIKIAGNLFNTSKVTGDTQYNWGLFLNSGTYEVYSSSFSTSFGINRTTLNILEYEN